ncbi:hypothetical protein ACLOJK_009179 [Asimina triloba]
MFCCEDDKHIVYSQVTDALRQAGLESSNLIIGIDFTKSNEWTGPTSFAPIIETATTAVEESGGQYHVLLIIADGQVTRSVDTKSGELSPQEQRTIDAIVKASEYPLSIIVVGVGDGPWDMMKEFDDNIPSRAFDNFQFVNFTEIMSKNLPPSKKETEFALAALMEIPSQYKATLELHMLGRGNAPGNVPLPPPVKHSSRSHGLKRSRSRSFLESASPYHRNTPSTSTTPPASDARDNQECPICTDHRKDLAFDCGHQKPFKSLGLKEVEDLGVIETDGVMIQLNCMHAQDRLLWFSEAHIRTPCSGFCRPSGGIVGDAVNYWASIILVARFIWYRKSREEKNERLSFAGQ